MDCSNVLNKSGQTIKPRSTGSQIKENSWSLWRSLNPHIEKNGDHLETQFQWWAPNSCMIKAVNLPPALCPIIIFPIQWDVYIWDVLFDNLKNRWMKSHRVEDGHQHLFLCCKVVEMGNPYTATKTVCSLLNHNFPRDVDDNQFNSKLHFQEANFYNQSMQWWCRWQDR